jgi:hypothetical protein
MGSTGSANPLGAVGGVFSGLGAIAEGQGEARVAFRDAELKERQAEEILSRAQSNAAIARLSGQQLRGEQGAAFAKGGVDVGTGSPLLMMEQTNIEIEREVQSINREAQFEAEQLRRGAIVDKQQAQDIKVATRLKVVGTLFGSVSDASKFKRRAGSTDPSLGTPNKKKPKRAETTRPTSSTKGASTASP